MNCFKCGTEVGENDLFCPQCGEPVKKEEVQETVVEPQENIIENTTTEVVVDSQNEDVAEPESVPVKKKSPAPFIIGGIIAVLVAMFVIVAIIVGVVVVKQVGKNNLKDELLRDWSRVETGTGNDSYYTLELDFTEDEIIYTFDSFYFDDELARIDYEVISKNKIEVEGFKTIEIEFNDEKTMMTFTPALTSDSPSENWFHITDY